MAFMIIVKFYCIHEGVKHTEHRYNSLFLNGVCFNVYKMKHHYYLYGCLSHECPRFCTSTGWDCQNEFQS